MLLELVAITFLTVRTLDGQEVHIQVDQIVSITKARDGESNKLLTDKARCVIGVSSGTFWSLAEECESVLRRIVEGTPP